MSEPGQLDLAALRKVAEMARDHYEDYSDVHQYIEAVEPSTVLALLDEVDRLKWDLRNAGEDWRVQDQTIDKLEAENTRLKARVAELEARRHSFTDSCKRCNKC